MPNANQITDPKVADLLKALGNAYLENGEHRKAVDKFNQLINFDPEDGVVVLKYALALAGMAATTSEALESYSKAALKHPDNEELFVTLATLFLKENITVDPALRVYYKCLSFSPPFEDQIRSALANVFQNSSSSVSIPEISQTLLDSEENPELLNLFLNTVWREHKFDEALTILKDLYLRSNKHPSYSLAFCKTLLEKKAGAEELNQPFSLTPPEAHLCFKHFDPQRSLTRIGEIESYLDFKDLLCCLQPLQSGKNGGPGEYELFLMANSIDNLDEITQTIKIPTDFDPAFRINSDLLKKICDSMQETGAATSDEYSNGVASHNLAIELNDFPVNTVALFEITNYSSNPETSKLPFQTFLKIIKAEMMQSVEIKCVNTADGILALATNAGKMVAEAIEIQDKLLRYNQVVDDSEIIHLRLTLHCTPLPFSQLENDGIRELRKAIKIHNFGHADAETVANAAADSNGAPELETSIIKTSEQIISQVSGLNSKKTGNYHLPNFPRKHFIYQLLFTDDIAIAQPALETKKHFGKYKVTQTLRQEYACSTYRGYDPQLERPVIIKTFQAEAFAEYKNSTALRKQFYDEVRKLNRITHPNIGVIYDAGEDEELFYLVREYIDAKNLRNYLTEEEPPATQDILEIFVSLCHILAHYHQSQVWHKNIRPENIFVIGDQKELKVVDGSLLQLRSSNSAESLNSEILAYSTPEQIQGQKLSQSCDTFQVAILLYESLTGTHPFRAETAVDTRLKVLAETPPAVTTINPELPAELDGILAKALSKNPEQRFVVFKDFETELLSLFDDRELSTRRRMYEILK